MNRYAFVLLATLAGTFVAPGFQAAPAGQHATGGETLVAKTSAFPVIGPVVFEACKLEDCSDTAN